MEYIDRIFAESVLFEQLKTKGYSDLLIALSLANNTITDRILATNGVYTKSVLRNIKRLIDDEIATAYGGLFATTQIDVEDSANIVYGLMMNNINNKLPTEVMNRLVSPKNIVQKAYSYTYIDNKIVGKELIKEYGFKELFKLTEDEHARQLKIVLASGVGQGMAPHEIVRRYGIKANNLSKGQVVGNVFTTVANARKDARSESYNELESMGIIQGYRYNSVLDSSTTQFCTEHDGRKYKDLESINGDLNSHFRCRSVATPLTGSKAEKERLKKEEKFSDFFKTQPKALRKAVLLRKNFEAHEKGLYKVNSVADLNKATSIDGIKKVLEDNYIE